MINTIITRPPTTQMSASSVASESAGGDGAGDIRCQLSTTHAWYPEKPNLVLYEGNNLWIGTTRMFAPEASVEDCVNDALSVFQYQAVAMGILSNHEECPPQAMFNALYEYALPPAMENIVFVNRNHDVYPPPHNGYTVLGDVLAVFAEGKNATTVPYGDYHTPVAIYHYADGVMRNVQKQPSGSYMVTWDR